MITDPRQRFAYSNLGWVDRGGLWIFDLESGRSMTAAGLEGVRYLTLLEGTEGHFALVHHFDGTRIFVTVQTYERPGSPIAALDVKGWQPVRTGDPSVWPRVPNSFVGYLNDAATGAAGYYLVQVVEDTATVARLNWFAGDKYDLMYQGIVGVAEVPGSNQLLFGIQRSSAMVLCSGDGSTVIRSVLLSGQSGNPVPRFRARAPEVLAVDYSALVCVEQSSWHVVREYDAGAGDGKRSFAGLPWWPESEQTILVPRPAAGDVLVLNMNDFELNARVTLGKQPLEAAMLRDGSIIARDWKTGDLLRTV